MNVSTKEQKSSIPLKIVDCLFYHNKKPLIINIRGFVFIQYYDK